MPETVTFYPARRRGLAVHLVAIVALLLAGGVGLLQASLTQISLNFFLFVIPAAAAVIGIPFLLLQVFALFNASYTLEKDGIRLHWGLRYEDIPEDQVEWVKLQTAYPGKLPLPILYWPGAVVGERHLPSGQVIEFMAARADQLVLVATSRCVYAISPVDPDRFLRTYRRLTELGSIAPLPARSVYPTFALRRFWEDRAARWLLLLGALLAFSLLAFVGAVIPGRDTVVMHFSFSGAATDFAPAVRLLLLPIVNSAFFVADLALGMFLYRRIELRPLSYLIWATSLVATLLFGAAVVFILLAS
jgi:hypothetical protein